MLSVLIAEKAAKWLHKVGFLAVTPEERSANFIGVSVADKSAFTTSYTNLRFNWRVVRSFLFHMEVVL